MSRRKDHVIKNAHKLFIKKGYRATSIQDILESSEISKGTFYNYFSSKIELLIAMFEMLYIEMKKERNALLIGQNPSDMNLLINQLVLQLDKNKKDKIITLLDEASVSNNPELKTFIREMQLEELGWLNARLVDIYDEESEAYLLDCAIMLRALMLHNFHYHVLAKGPEVDSEKIVRYSVNRLDDMVKGLSHSKEQLLDPEDIRSLLPGQKKDSDDKAHTLFQQSHQLKNYIEKMGQADKNQNSELLDFIVNELVKAPSPRKFLIVSALSSLKNYQDTDWTEQLDVFEELVSSLLE